MDLAGNLTITGTPDNANGGLMLTTTAANTFNIVDGVTPVISGLVVGGNITVNTSIGDDIVTLNLAGGPFGGSFTFNAGSGNDTFNMMGANPMGGSLTLNSVQNFNPTGVIIGGNVTINDALENPTVPDAVTMTTVTIGGNLSFTGNNGFANLLNVVGASSIGGNVTVSEGNSPNIFTSDSTLIGGSVLYSGGSNNDTVTFTGTSVGGSMTVSLGFAAAAGNALTFDGGVIGRNLSVTGGAAIDSISISPGAATTIGGSAYFSLGDGTNTLTFKGLFGTSSSSLSYFGGAGVDTLTYNAAAGSSRVRLTANMGAGDDIVNFASGAGAATNPSFAYIDFGAGVDTVTGTINFPFVFLNLP
jgi:hypothetical protein